MKVTQTKIEEILSILAETPEWILAACNGLTNDQLLSKPHQKAWSVNEVLAHLRACVDIWEKDIHVMLEEDTPRVRYISPRTYIRRTNYPQLNFWVSFHAFAQERDAFLKVLRGLAFDDWSRDAVIKDRVHTVYSQARRMALHERDHLDQIEAILNEIDSGYLSIGTLYDHQ